MPSLPSLPIFDESGDHPSQETDSLDMGLSVGSNPLHSTPAVYSSYTASTIRPPLSTGSTVRFAHSVASMKSSKSGSLSASRGNTSRQYAIPPKDFSFEVSAIPSLPNASYDLEIRSSDQDTSGMQSSVAEAHLPPMHPHATRDGDIDLFESLQSINRSESPSLPEPEPTPRKKYDYSVSLRSEPKVRL
jgi:hypothetical protein